MHFKIADNNDFNIAFRYIQDLWKYNVYDEDETRQVYEETLEDPDSFIFFLIDEDGEYHGICHGIIFNTFWMSGKTCYLSTIICNEEERGRGYGRMLMDHACEIARSRGCRAIVLDSGTPRTEAHRFYEKYGFEKGCYGFELML